MASLTTSITQGCSASGGVLTITSASPAPGASADLTYSATIINSAGIDVGSAFDVALLPVSFDGLPDGTYAVRVRADENDGSNSYVSRLYTQTISCAGSGTGGLTLDVASATDETAAGNDGTATVQARGGTAPLTATLRLAGAVVTTLPATSGAPTTFPALAPNTYTVRVTDNATPPNFVEAAVTVAAYVAPVQGCLDEYADNYDPGASSDTTPTSCTYTPYWRAAWQDMAVRVAAAAGQTAGYLTALLRIGFRPGHPLGAARPLGDPLTLRATVGPDGFATFRLGPYLRPQLGAPDGAGGYRLDLNSPTATLDDLYVGYELRRPDGELLEHGYALNAAVPDSQLLADDGLLSPFAPRLPVWPGFDNYPVSQLYPNASGGGPALGLGFAVVGSNGAGEYDAVSLPCPLNPLPVAWLAPGGGYGLWVFQGRAELGDEVGEGQAYNEAGTYERRYSQRGDARKTILASSGTFKGRDLMDGLRTLWSSPQVWYLPVIGGPWVPVTLEPGSFPAGRLGVARQQVSISFTEAASQPVQGQ